MILIYTTLIVRYYALFGTELYTTGCFLYKGMERTKAYKKMQHLTYKCVIPQVLARVASNRGIFTAHKQAHVRG